jgi:hypothetical protein
LTACVSWQGNTDHIKFLKKPAEIFRRLEDAEEAGVKFSKSWVDDKLDKLRSLG